ncbi:EAL domain-containing protein [Yoonia sp. BS5-3]|uniref:EAL domain-containing protein n=1 Tax=Yoonia phaeophyticola TaxID=3137369 RepID=A0ABZ2V6N1_9RHOB
MGYRRAMSGVTDKDIRNLEDFSGIASDWFWETDAEHRFCYFSGRMEETTKICPDNLIGLRRDHFAEGYISDPKWRAHLEDLQNHRPFRNFEYEIERPTDGSSISIRISGQPFFDETGTFTGYRGIGHDITAEKEAMRQLLETNAALAERNEELDEARKALERSAYEDLLTGQLNRRAFERDLAAALSIPQTRSGLLHIDLDRFKWVNDTMGHPAGDAVLVTAAERICRVIDKGGTVYRVGGDEFMVILQPRMTTDAAVMIGDSIIEAMAEPIAHEHQNVTVGASIGLAFGKAGHISPAQLVTDADVALYEAKANGRNILCQINAEVQARIQAHRRMATDIPLAIERSEIVPYYQPQVHVGTGAVVGAEALVRWFHPTLGILQPRMFLDAASELGLMAEIDRLMLRQALEMTGRLRSNGQILPSISVNISAARLMDPNLPNDIESYWTDKRCRLSIELLETIYFDEMRETPQISENLNRLRELGVRIEIDDFGSGRASITGLLKIRPDRLKIDRSLIQSAVADPTTRNVVAAILDMTHSLGVEAMAEGAETRADIETIRALGCNVFQGYAVSHPLAEAELAAYLGTRHQSAAG